MQENVYLWNENYYCEGDIVSILTDYEPWSAWAEHNEIGAEPVEEQLDSIAAAFKVNRNNAGSVRRKNFPVLLPEPPTDPNAFCRACLHWFTLPDLPPPTDGRPSVPPESETMQPPPTSHLMGHAAAMLHPEGENESTVTTLFTELARLADRFTDDATGLDVVEKLGSSLISLLQHGGTGRLDKSALDKQIRDIVNRAGGDGNGL